jgi:hypothetical protein
MEMERSHVGRTKLSFGKVDWAHLLEMAAVGMLLAGGFPVRSMGAATRAEDVFIAGERNQRTRQRGAE